MLVSIEISSSDAAEFGDNLEQKVHDLVVAEAIRLGHCRRSRPRTVPEMQGSSETQALGARLLAIYSKKRARYAAGKVPKELEAQESAVRVAVVAGDREWLQQQFEVQPWTKI